MISTIEVLECQVCKINNSKYKCPKCNIRYCSTGCYSSEKHNNCSEEFFKINIISELKQTATCDSAIGKQSIVDILKRINTLDAPDEHDSFLQRFSTLDLNQTSTQDIINTLTPTELQKFHDSIHNIQIQHYNPWWKTPKVVLNSSPHSLVNLPPITPKLIFNTIDILFSYTFTCIHYHEDLLPVTDSQTHSDKISCILSHSFILSTRKPFAHETLLDLIAFIKTQSLLLKEFNHTLETIAFILLQIVDILLIKNGTYCALNHLLQLFCLKFPDSMENKKSMIAYQKKLEFYSIVMNQEIESCTIQKIINQLQCSANDMIQEYKTIQTEINKYNREKVVLIQELE